MICEGPFQPKPCQDSTVQPSDDPFGGGTSGGISVSPAKDRGFLLTEMTALSVMPTPGTEQEKAGHFSSPLPHWDLSC